MPKGRVYLGNSVYAERDGYSIVLSVFIKDRTVQSIYVTPDVYNALLSFKADMDEEIAEEAENG